MAALCVVFCHLVVAFWPAAFQPRSTLTPLLSVITQSPLRVTYDGAFAVRVFFVLSGVVLSIGFFQRPSSDGLAGAAVRRYFRLTPSIFVSVLVAFLLMWWGAYAHQIVARAPDRQPHPWLGTLYDFAPSFTEALKEGAYGVYVDYDDEHTHNVVLWTMGVEMYGSLFVFAFLALAGRLRRRWLLYVILGAVLHRYWRMYLDFLAGVALCDVFVTMSRTGRQRSLGPFLGTIILVGGLCLASIQPEWLSGRLAEVLAKRQKDFRTAAALLVIGVGLYCPCWIRLFERRSLIWLGRVSFPLYLLHLPILCSLGCHLFLWLHGPLLLSYDCAVVLSFVAVVTTSLGAAGLMYIAVDQWSIGLGRWVYGFFRPHSATLDTHRQFALPSASAKVAEPVLS